MKQQGNFILNFIFYLPSMKKIILIFSFLLFIFHSFSQYTLRLVVTNIATRKLDDIYIAGNFNDWKPGETEYKLKPLGTRKEITLSNLSAGHYKFKFTRGNWDKVETTEKGEDIQDREIDLQNDTSINISIAGWKDDSPVKPRQNTATAQVHILDTAFFIPQLNRYRRIWIYLPKDYTQNSKKYYSVLYMQDGQNLFNEQTAPFGEWGVDECLDSLENQNGNECIVVGMTEYNPYDNDKYGKGEGKQYVDFLAQTLKPFIDAKYRTVKDMNHTFIAGSSLGALISLYAVMQYPQVFGRAGVFSPAFWFEPSMYEDMQKISFTKMPQFYFYAGVKEDETMVNDMQRMEKIINAKNCCNIIEYISPTAQHNETYWRKYFPGFYKWLMQQ
jgi:predicted alpha/beta superfamily hydrolase